MGLIINDELAESIRMINANSWSAWNLGVFEEKGKYSSWKKSWRKSQKDDDSGVLEIVKLNDYFILT